MKRKVEVIRKSEELSQGELSKIAEALESFEDWQITGEGLNDVGNFYLQAEVDNGIRSSC